jgi:hypothetical protein
MYTYQLSCINVPTQFYYFNILRTGVQGAWLIDVRAWYGQ